MFFASLISLVGIGIIAIPTGIIAAGFSHAIGHTDLRVMSPADVSKLDEDELLVLQAEVAKELGQYGYVTTVSCGKQETKKEE